MIMNITKAKVYLIPAAVCLLGIIALLYYYFFTGFSTCEKTEYLYIDESDTPETVFQKLEPYASKHGMTALRTLLRHSNYAQHMRTGRYVLEPTDGVLTVFRRLKNGQQSPVMLTVPESRTTSLLAGRLAQKLMLDSATIAQALADNDFCRQWGEGYDTCTIAALFVPNTYEVYWNISLKSFMERMVKEHDNFWNNDRRQKAQALGLTANEVCTLASIVDEETANNSEKPMIAGMYLNRLKENMPLQADPTVKYALKDFALRRILHKHLTANSPYNTYKNTGLPPGPIKIASIKGIDAVLNAVKHNYLYMCAKEDFSGTHNFAATYREHLQNAARYAKALNERGIK